MNATTTPVGDDVLLDLRIRQEYVRGEALDGFFERLRLERKPYGRRCPSCGRVTCPPRDFCSRCMTDAGEWVPLGVGGEIRTLTVIGEAFEGFPAPPFAIAFVQLDGADTAILNRLEGRDWSKPGDWHRLIRKRATMVFRGTPLGSWLDFHFVIDDAR